MSKKSGSEIKIRLVKSVIGRPKKHKRTVEALGLRKINQVVTHKSNPAILGMVDQVKHLVTVED